MIHATECSPGYPESLDELTFCFPDNECCAAYLGALRWPGPDSFHCSRCGASKWWAAGCRRECAQCGTQYSATSGTTFHMTKIALPRWFEAFWWLVQHKGVPSLKELRRILDATNFEAARPMLAKMGAALASREGLKGCSVVHHYTIGGHEILVGMKTLKSGEPQMRLQRFDKAGTTTLAKYARSRLICGGKVVPGGPKVVPETPGAPSAAPETSGDPPPVFPPWMHEAIRGLTLRLLAAPSITTEQLDLVLTLHSYQWNYRDHSVGELWRLALLHALRRVRGRGLPPWPPRSDRRT